jgi:hypothetical protein
VKGLRAINTDGFGVADNLGIVRILDAGNYVFLAISNPTLGASIYRSTDGEDWELISAHGIVGNSANHLVLSLVWFNDALYAGTWQILTPSLGARLFRANAKAGDVNDIEWEPVTLDGFGNMNNSAFTSGIVFKGYIYFGAFNPSQGTEIWRSKTGDPHDWEMCAPKSFNRPDNSDSTTMYVHKGYLYLGTEVARISSTGSAAIPSMGTAIYRTAGGGGEITWEQVNIDGFGEVENSNTGAITVFGRYMYAGVWNPSGCQVWRSDMQGELPWTWEKVMTGGSGAPRNQTIFSVAVLDGRIYFGCIGSHLGILGLDLGEGKLLTSEDGVDWTEIKSADFISGRIWGVGSLATYQGKLYIGLLAPLLLPLGARCQLWVYEPLQ